MAMLKLYTKNYLLYLILLRRNKMIKNYSFNERVAITKKVAIYINAKSPVNCNFHWFNDCIDLGTGQLLYFDKILEIYKKRGL